jgi:protein-S-isoprenylcysteine O-methyltransferase Ste14
MRSLFGSIVFFVVAPGTVAGLVPWLLTGWQSSGAVPVPLTVLGAALLAAGVAVLLHAFGQFVLEGFGTPFPAAPPRHLVVGGLYRYVRNPMYVALVAAVLGQALVLGRPNLLVYAVLVWAVTAAFVRFREEPVLARRFGAEYTAYRRAVRAWWPRLRPWDGAGLGAARTAGHRGEFG